MQITAEIMQTYDTYDHLTFAMDDLTALLYLKFPLFNSTCSTLHKHKWRDKKVEWPYRKRQMYKCPECHEP